MKKILLLVVFLASSWAPLVALDAETIVESVVSLGYDGENSMSTPYSFSTFPNPTSGEIFIKANNAESRQQTSLEVYNMIGKKVKDVGMHDFSFRDRASFSIAELPEGVYFVRVSFMNGEVVNKKVILSK